MSRSTTVRRAVAEIRWDEGSRSVAWVGDRSIHHYWTLLSAYFRDVLLPPHRRAEENGVSWSWREDEEPAPVSASELRSLRKSLAEEQQLFAESLAGGGLGRRGQAAGLKGQMNVEQLGAVMAGVVSKLVERSDDALRGYVCRTESGLRVHSWGADAPACPTYPDTSGLEIAGRVLVGGKPARHDVVLESSDGETITEVPSDDSGEFRFSKLSPGEYRLRARTLRRTFPPHGLAVTLGRQSVSDLVLADARAETVSPLVSARRRSRQRSYRTPALAALLVLGAAGGVWWWRTQPVDTAAPVAAVPAKAPEKASPADLRPGTVPVAAGSRPESVRSSTPPPTSATSAVPVPASPVAVAPSVAGATNPSSSAVAVAAPLPVEGQLSSQLTLPPSLAGLPGTAKGQPAAAGGVPPAGSGGSPASPGAAGAGAATASSVASSANASASAATATPGGTTETSSSLSAGSPASTPTSPAAPSPAAAVAATPTPTPEPKPAESPSPATHVASAVAAVPVPASPEPEPAPIAIRIPDTAAATSPTVAALPSSDAAGTVATPDASPAAEASVPATSHRSDANPSISETASAAANSPGKNPLPTESPAPVPSSPASESRLSETKSLLRALPAPLSRTVRVRVTPWRTRLLGDAILPTAPVPLRQMEAVSELRTRLLAEQDARIPGAFRAPKGRMGVVLEFAAERATDALTWVDDAGAPVDRGAFSSGRAEIAWEPGPAEQVFRLRRADRSIAAEVRVAASGREFTVRTPDDTRTWLQLVVTSSGAEPAVSVLSWRTATAAPMPVSWRLLEVEEARAEAGVLIPLGSLSGAVALQGCALFDAASGWALVTEVRQAADRPLGE